MVHRNLSPVRQAEEVDKVKRSESGMILDPITLGPDRLVREAEEIMGEMILRAIEEAQARTEVARKEVLPRFDVFAGHEVELDRTGTNVGLGLTIPLWNRNRGEIASALFAYRSARSAMMATRGLKATQCPAGRRGKDPAAWGPTAQTTDAR